MPLLGALLASLFAGLAQFFVQYVTKKVAVGAAAIVVLSGVTVIVFVAFRVVLGSLQASLTGGALTGLSMAIPPVAGACIAAITSIWTACTLYAWQRRALDLFVKA